MPSSPTPPGAKTEPPHVAVARALAKSNYTPGMTEPTMTDPPDTPETTEPDHEAARGMAGLLKAAAERNKLAGDDPRNAGNLARCYLALADEVERLKAEFTETDECLTRNLDLLDVVTAERNRALATVARLRGALKLYANKEHYEPYRCHEPECHPEAGCVSGCGDERCDVERDGGETARAALLKEAPPTGQGDDPK